MQIHWLGIVYGLAAAFLSMAIVTLLGWLILALAGLDDPAVAAAAAGAPVGALAGGWVGGRTSNRSVFHGALVGVLFAGAVTLLSVLDGSPASAGTMVGFLVGGLLIGAVGGWLALRRRATMANRPVD